MKLWFKRNYISLLSFGLTAVIMLIIFSFVLKITPSSNISFLTSDLFDQYVSFLNYFRDSILKGESLFYSFSYSIGGNFTGIFAYFCASPLNIILLFSNAANMETFIILLAILKISFCALTMSIYLKQKCSNKLVVLALSLAYALSSYNLSYIINIMWLDVVFMLPLILLALERLIDKDKPYLYIAFLAIMIFSNYYIAFPVCLFLVLYFVYYCLLKKLNKSEFFKKTKKFILASLFSAVLDAFLLLPVIIDALSGKAVNAVQETHGFFNFNPLQLFAQFFIENTQTTVYSDLPFFYVTIFAFILFLLSFFNKKFSKREKVLNAILFTILMIIPTIGIVDKIFHCLQVPNFFNCRYAFIMPCFIIMVAANNYNDIEGINYKDYRLYFLIFIVLLQMAFYSNITIATYVSLGVAIVYVFILLFFKQKAIYIAILFIIIELFINVKLIYVSYVFMTKNDYESVYRYLEEIRKYMPTNQEFYRIETKTSTTHNDNFTNGIYGVGTFSPTLNNNVNYFLKDFLGIPTNHKYVIDYFGETTFSKSLLNIKYEYVIDKDIVFNQNLYLFPFMYRTTSFDSVPLNDIITNQNNLYHFLSGDEEDLFEEYDDYEISKCVIENKKIVSEENSCTFENKSKDDNYEYYVSLKPGESMSFKTTRPITTYIVAKKETVFSLDNGVEVLFTDNIESMTFYRMKKSKLSALTMKLSQNQVNIIYRDQNNFHLTIENDEENQMIFTTIPYDTGWHIIVNNEEIEPSKVLNALIGIKIPKGNVEIEMYYFPRGYIIGVILATLSVTFAIAVGYRKKILYKCEVQYEKNN